MIHYYFGFIITYYISITKKLKAMKKFQFRLLVSVDSGHDGPRKNHGGHVK